SSRRRHTRSTRDWSSDVCSSDLDLVLCDLMMPDVTGMAFYEELRAAQPGAETRIVFMTGAFGAQTISFLRGINNPSLEKPFEGEDRNERRVGKEWRCRWSRV